MTGRFIEMTPLSFGLRWHNPIGSASSFSRVDTAFARPDRPLSHLPPTLNCPPQRPPPTLPRNAFPKAVSTH